MLYRIEMVKSMKAIMELCTLVIKGACNVEHIPPTVLPTLFP